MNPELDLTLSRVVRAPRAAVWSAWTDPARFEKWWLPAPARAAGPGSRAMRLVLTEFVTLGGVSQGPGSPTEDTSDGFTRGGWLVPYLDKVFVQRTSDRLDLADGLLLGRRTAGNSRSTAAHDSTIRASA